MPEWIPTPAQQKFLASPAFEKLYGGAAGGGKTDALIMSPLRYIHIPQFKALRLRRTQKENDDENSRRAAQWYIGFGAKQSGYTFTFPSGASVTFAGIQHDKDVYKFAGSEYQDIGFDELTTFTEWQYRFLFSRARSSHGIPVSISSTSNPGGPGHEWVLKRFGPWLDRSREFVGHRASSGELLWCRESDNGPIFSPFNDEPTLSLSRTFVAAKLSDNPHLNENDPEYRLRLMQLDPVTRAQLLEGDWNAYSGRGAFFKRNWFEIIPTAPSVVKKRVRHWDLAATVEGFDNKGKPTDPDWTVGVKASVDESNIFYIEHVYRFRGKPNDVQETIKTFAFTDGKRCTISIPQDPGQAGKYQVKSFTSFLAGFIVKAEKETGSKIERAKPVSSQAQARNIKVVNGPWLDVFFQELESFPEGKKDQVDALSGAMNYLCAKEGAPSFKGIEWSGPKSTMNDPSGGWDDD